MNHVRGPTDKGNIKFTDPLLFARSRSNNERGGPSEMRPGLEKPSPTATAHLRIEIACRHIVTTSLTLSAYKMHAKLREEGFRYPSLPHTMLAWLSSCFCFPSLVLSWNKISQNIKQHPHPPCKSTSWQGYTLASTIYTHIQTNINLVAGLAFSLPHHPTYKSFGCCF